MKTLLSVLLAALAVPSISHGQSAPAVIPLWADGAPGSEGRKDEPERIENERVKNVHNPSLTVFLPPADKANGAAMIICPGGGHRHLTVVGEGSEPAAYLNNLGVACFVLKYRLARDEGSPYGNKETLPQDARRAMRLVRSRAEEFKIDPHRVGMIGFSAGGEVVSLVAYESGNGDPQAADAIDRLNSRPDFQILVYPGGGGVPDTVAADAPPALMVVSMDDKSHVTPVVNLLAKYRESGASIEVHLLQAGGHAYGVGARSKFAAVQHWPDRMADWLGDRGYLKPADGK